MPNLKFVSIVVLELFAFNAQKFMGSCDPGHAPFRKKISGIMSGLSMGACVPNLKFVSLATLELLAFNAQKFKGSRDPGHAPFSKNIFRRHVGTFPGSKHAKFEVRTFSHFGAISI